MKSVTDNLIRVIGPESVLIREELKLDDIVFIFALL